MSGKNDIVSKRVSPLHEDKYQKNWIDDLSLIRWDKVTLYVIKHANMKFFDRSFSLFFFFFFISTQWHIKTQMSVILFVRYSPVILMITSIVSCFSLSSSCRNRTTPVSRSTLKTGPEILYRIRPPSGSIPVK